MCSLLMTAFLVEPAARKQNWDQSIRPHRYAFQKGFRMLTLSWSDGNTLIPVNSCLLASAKEANIIGPVKNFDNRTIAGKRRKLAQTKAPEAMMALLDTALSAGLKADYVLFDSWFSNPAQITAIHSKGMDVIAMLKKSSRIKYSYCGEQLNIKEIYSRNKTPWQIKVSAFC